MVGTSPAPHQGSLNLILRRQFWKKLTSLLILGTCLSMSVALCSPSALARPPLEVLGTPWAPHCPGHSVL